MKLGMSLPTYGGDHAETGVEAIAATAEGAERIGLDSVWTFERVLRVLEPVKYSAEGPEFTLPEAYRNSFSPLETLAFVAGRTRTIRLGTSIVNALFHPPAILGRSFATVDALSGGRVIAGLGQAWMAQEFAVAGVPMKRRGAGFSEYLDVLRAVWGPDPVAFKGRFYEIPESEINPKPVQAGGPPIVVGGATPAAIRRAAQAGAGINPNTADRETLQGFVSTFREAASAAGKDPDTLPIIIRVNTAEIAEQPVDGDRPALTGSPEQIAEDIAFLEPLGVTEAFWSLSGPWQERVPALERLLAAV